MWCIWTALSFCHSRIQFRVTYLCVLDCFDHGVFWVLTHWRNCKADLTFQSHHVVHLSLGTSTLLLWPCSPLLILCLPSRMHLPKPRPCPAFPVNRLFFGGGGSTRLDTSSPGMTWQWPEGVWHQNSLKEHTLSTTSVLSQHPLQQCAQDGSLITPNTNITMGGDAV